MSRDRYYSLKYTPLSPVHVGTGRDYEPTGYVIEDGTLYAFDGLAALRTLSGVQRAELNRILSAKPDDRMLLGMQSFFFQNRERLIAASSKQVRVNPSLEAFYKDRVGQVSQQESGGRRVHNRLEIERTAWNGANAEAYLPGSGLKGAVRTALLDQCNDGRRLDPDLKRGRQANSRLQEQLFRGKFETDPLRLLRFGDGLPEAGSGPVTEVYFALNRKKQPVEKNGTLVESQAEQKNLYQLLECLDHHGVRPLTGTLAIQDLAGLSRSRKTPELTFEMVDICRACNRFYRAHFEREMQILRERGFVEGGWVRKISELLAAFTPAMEEDRAFLLRVGRHSGAESVTLNDLPRQIRIMKGKGQAETLDHAKTLWLAGRERQPRHGLLPFGWMLVEVYEEGREPMPWPGPQAGADTTHWRGAVAQRLDRARHEVEEEQRRQREREAEERAAAEKARAEQEALERTIEEARASLPEDAARMEERRLAGAWVDNSHFLDDAEALVGATEKLSDAARELLLRQLEARWSGITADPDAIQGKKQKPKYKDRPKSLVKKLI